MPVMIRVRHELPGHSMRLLATLHAQVVVDPDAPPCSRFRGGSGGFPYYIDPRGCRECRRLEKAAR